MNKHHTYYLNCDEAPQQIYRNKYYMNGALPSGKTDWKGKPADWSDIRKDCPANSIALYAGHKADFSQYDNLGFNATCTGGYNVYIDGTQYGTTYASGAACTITWSTSGITTGDDITTHTALKAHKIWIEPATEGNNITAFKCTRVAASGEEEQGVLWAHFNFTHEIDLTRCFGESGVCCNPVMEALTAKGNLVKVNGLAQCFYNAESLTYVPTIDGQNNTLSIYALFYRTAITNVDIKNLKFTEGSVAFYNCANLEKLPKGLDYSQATSMWFFLLNNTALEDTYLNVNSTSLTDIKIWGTSIKGLRVSSSAPFSGGEPQIDVQYTSLDRAALVQLFNDLPTVTGGQIINITGATGSSNLTDEDLAIAENKGWTVVGGPAYEVYATFSGASVGDTIKLNDGMATSNYTWSAYPSDTSTTGSYTQTATATAVNSNIIEVSSKPSQDNKDVSTKAGKMYYAYTNENDSDDSLYTVDNVISSSSVLYENTGTTEFIPTALNPQPEFTAQNEGLVNATEIGTGLINSKGLYSGFNSSSYIVCNNNYSVNNHSWSIETETRFFSIPNTTKCIIGYKSAGSNRYKCIQLNIGENGRANFALFISTNGSSWTNSNFGSISINTLDIYLLKVIYDGTKYVLKVSRDNGKNWVDDITIATSTPIYGLEGMTFGSGGGGSDMNSLVGQINMIKTKLIINDDTTTFYNSKSDIIIGNDLYERNSTKDDATSIPGLTVDIDTVDNTTINTVTITSDQTATIETLTNATSSNNDNVITDGSYHLFNLTVPTGITPIIESRGIQFQTGEMPLFLKKNSGLTLLLKEGNNAYYRNTWIITRDYELHYQQINFSYPSGATVSCKVNNVAQSNLTPYVYAGDIVSWTCDNGGTVTTGTYTVKYSSKDGNIQTITIS